MRPATDRIAFLAGLLLGYARQARAAGSLRVNLNCADVEELAVAAANAAGVTLAQGFQPNRQAVTP